MTSDQQSEDSAACKTFTGSGATCAAAWNAAAQTMNGQPFYGLMDLAVLPAGCSWPLAEEIAQLLQSTARPAPEIAVFVLDPAVQMPIQDQTPTLYENLKALEEKQRMEQMPKGSIHERLAWGIKKSEMENQQRKKNKSKNREMER